MLEQLKADYDELRLSTGDIDRRVVILENRRMAIEQLQQRYAGYLAEVVSIEQRVAALEQGGSNGNAHFESLLSHPHKHYAESLRDLSRYAGLLEGGAGHIGTTIFYDDVKKCIRIFQPKGQISIPIGAQIRPAFAAITDAIVGVQWESMYDMVGYNGGKMYQLAWTPGGDDRLLEIQASPVGSPPNYSILHSMRTYGGGFAGGNNNPEQLSTGPLTSRNVQPPLFAPIRQMAGVKHVGDGGTAYLVKPGIWVRYTVSWDLSVSPARIKCWLSDELTDPALWMADPDDHSLGFIYQPDAANHGVNQFWFEFNNSNAVASADLSTWHRNFIVFKGADVPLGGRPVR